MAGRYTGILIIVLLLGAAACLAPAACARDDNGGFPDSTLAIRQAHLIWVAGITEAEMNAAVTYIGTRFSTDTSRMNALLGKFRAQEAEIPSATTQKDLDSLILSLRDTTTSFNNETAWQMAVGQGSKVKLAAAVNEAVAGNPYLEEKRNSYWRTRTNVQMADFDARMSWAQAVIDDMQAKGYDAAPAQKTLDMISARERFFKEALESKDDGRLNGVNQEILDLSDQLEQQVALSTANVPKDISTQFFIGEGYRVVARADQMNLALMNQRPDIGQAETVLSETKKDLYSAQNTLNSGRLDSAAAALLPVKKDLRDLASAYRDIASSWDIPAEMAGSLRTLAVAIDNTADRMEAGS